MICEWLLTQCHSTQKAGWPPQQQQARCTHQHELSDARFEHGSLTIACFKPCGGWVKDLQAMMDKACTSSLACNCTSIFRAMAWAQRRSLQAFPIERFISLHELRGTARQSLGRPQDNMLLQEQARLPVQFASTSGRTQCRPQHVATLSAELAVAQPRIHVSQSLFLNTGMHHKP